MECSIKCSRLAFPVQQWQPDASFSSANFQPIAAFLMSPCMQRHFHCHFPYKHHISARESTLAASERVHWCCSGRAGYFPTSAWERKAENCRPFPAWAAAAVCVLSEGNFRKRARRQTLFASENFNEFACGPHAQLAQAPHHLGAGKCALRAIFSNYTARAARKIINICSRTRATARIRGR